MYVYGISVFRIRSVPLTCIQELAANERDSDGEINVGTEEPAHVIKLFKQFHMTSYMIYQETDSKFKYVGLDPI